jgi:hypothetical protein
MKLRRSYIAEFPVPGDPYPCVVITNFYLELTAMKDKCEKKSGKIESCPYSEQKGILLDYGNNNHRDESDDLKGKK